MLRTLDLFSGIMGFTLGLEATGRYRTVGFCEIEPYCQALTLEKRPDTQLWPDIERLNDWLKKALTLLQAAFPARTYLTQAKVLGYSTTEAPAKPQPVQDSGGRWSIPFAWYDHEKHMWRTWQQSLSGAWEPFLETWPTSGMTRNGIAYRRHTLDRNNAGDESGFWPTPQAGANNPAAHNAMSGDFKKRFCQRAGIPMTGKLNPQFVEWLMGYPIGWTALEDSAMLSSLKSYGKSQTRKHANREIVMTKCLLLEE